MSISDDKWVKSFFNNIELLMIDITSFFACFCRLICNVHMKFKTSSLKEISGGVY